MDHEVSAYKAQYSYNGEFKYLEVNQINRDIVSQSSGMITPLQTSITDINSINRAMVNSIGYVSSVIVQGRTVHGIANLYPPVMYTNGISRSNPGLQWTTNP